MDIATVEGSLPNGFHDAYLVELSVNFATRDMLLVLEVLVGNDDQPANDRYRTCNLSIHEFAVVILEPPIAYRAIRPGRGIQIDRTNLSEAEKKAIVAQGYNVAPGNFWLALFVFDWNSRIIINARDAALKLW